MNAPITDKQRITMLEMRVGELERELALMTGRLPADVIGAERVKLLAALKHSIGPVSLARPKALTLLAILLERPGHAFSRRALCLATRSSRSWTDNPESHSVDVSLSDMRRALTKLGVPRAIQFVPDCGWLISRENAEWVRNRIGVNTDHRTMEDCARGA